MQLPQFETSDLRDQLRAALIHQARQPLYALQNYLAATVHVSDRLKPSPDIELMRKCLSQMQSSIEKLSGTLTNIAEFDVEEKNTSPEIDLLEFLHETFQISGFVARQFGLRIQWDIDPEIRGTVEISRRTIQLNLIRWILATCTSEPFEGISETPVRILAESSEAGIRFCATKDTIRSVICMDELTGHLTPRVTRSDADEWGDLTS